MIETLLLATDFSGLGSPEEGLKKLNIPHNIVFACERDKHARASYKANHSANIFYDDVTTRDNKQAPYSDCYVFGFPCQAFSIAGKQMGFEDMRGTLVFNSADYIREKRPRVFVAENVKNLLSHDGGKTFRTIIDTFAISENGNHNMFHKIDCLGYHVFYSVHNSKNFGVAQNRERIFIIGFRDEHDAIRFKQPRKIKLDKCIFDYLEKNVDERYYLNDTNLQYLTRAQKRGRLRVNIDDGSGIATCITTNLHKGLHNGGETLIEECLKVGQLPRYQQNGRVYDAAGLSPTLTVHPGGGYEPPKIFTGKRIRRLTPKECYRLQGYSDEFYGKCKAVNSETQLYRQAGNSITVDTIAEILKSVLIAIGYKF